MVVDAMIMHVMKVCGQDSKNNYYGCYNTSKMRTEEVKYLSGDILLVIGIIVEFALLIVAYHQWLRDNNTMLLYRMYHSLNIIE